MLVLFGVFVVLLVFGMPISFSMFLSSLAYMIAYDMPLITLIQRVATGVNSFTLLAAPCFILAGAVMNTGGVTDRIFNWCNKLVGHIPGGLGHTNVFASVIFAGMSGTAVGDAGGLGAVELRAMRDRGFDDDFSLAITASSSTIGPIIPPSLPAVMFGVVGGVSIGRLFLGGVVPGLLMAVLLSAMVYIIAKKRNYPREPKATLREFGDASKRAFFPLMAPVLCIACILSGVITPTEAGCMMLVYATVLGFLYREINLKSFYQTCVESCGTTLSVLFIIASGTIFGWIVAIGQVPQMVASLFIEHISNVYVALIAINIFLLICGMFLDSMCAISLLTPILLPVAVTYGVDPVHFGIMMILNIMIGLLTPPVGVVLFILSSISGVSFDRIVKANWPFLFALLIALAIVTFVPPLVTWLPTLVYG